MLRLFALLPVVQYFVLYLVSARTKRLALLKNMYAITILDWLFVPFNVLLPYAVVFSWLLFALFLCISLLGSLTLYHFWHRTHYEKTSYFTTEVGISAEGWVHYVFMSMQGAIVLTVLFSAALSFWYFVLLGLLLLYCIGFLLIVHFVRKQALSSKPELSLLLLGIVLVVVRFFL